MTEEIPVNIFIDYASQFTGTEEGFCTIDVCGVESVPTKVFASEEEYLKSGIRYAPDMPNCCAQVETLYFTFSLYFRWDEPIEKGYILQGIAWLFGDISFE